MNPSDFSVAATVSFCVAVILRLTVVPEIEVAVVMLKKPPLARRTLSPTELRESRP